MRMCDQLWFPKLRLHPSRAVVHPNSSGWTDFWKKSQCFTYRIVKFPTSPPINKDLPVSTWKISLFFFVLGSKPWKIHMLNPKMEVWKMIFLFNWVFLRFHVCFLREVNTTRPDRSSFSCFNSKLGSEGNFNLSRIRCVLWCPGASSVHPLGIPTTERQWMSGARGVLHHRNETHSILVGSNTILRR